MKVKKKHIYLSKNKLEELKKEICDELSKRYSIKIEFINFLAEKYNVSTATIRRRIKDIKMELEQKENSNTDETEIEYINSDDSIIETKIIPYCRSKTINVGLIKDRHNMPVNHFIFNEILSDDMFNYNYLDSIISEFILNKIGVTTINGVNHASRDLCVYVTGLQCALASLIKMCSKYNVGLTLFHWNKDTDLYESQTIFKNNFKDTKDYFKDISGNIYFTDNCKTIEEAKDCKVIFLLKEIQNKRDEKDNLSFVSNNTYIYKDEMLAWKEYLRICKAASYSKNEIAVYLDCGRIDSINENFVKIRTMARTYNFEAEKRQASSKQLYRNNKSLYNNRTQQIIPIKTTNCF